MPLGKIFGETYYKISSFEALESILNMLENLLEHFGKETASSVATMTSETIVGKSIINLTILIFDFYVQV